MESAMATTATALFIDSNALINGDLYRTLRGAGTDQVLCGTFDELTAYEGVEDGERLVEVTIWKQVGEGDDAYRVDTGGRGC